jgi:poly-gamma-glutamate synthesis protein (capsule biosynthesis protein)
MRRVATTFRVFPVAAALVMAASCEDGGWPEPGTYFPFVYTPEDDLEPWEDVRWETETWDPSDPEMTALYVLKVLYHRLGAPEEELAHFELMRGRIPQLGSGLRLSFVGDVMYIDSNWSEYALAATPLLDGDLRIANLETPTSRDHSTEPRALGLYAFNSPPEILDNLPVDLLQLNNNHSLDAEDLGLENTIAEVEAREIRHTGVDAQLVIDVAAPDGETHRVAFLAYTWGVNDGRRSENGHELHIVPFGHIGEDISLDLVDNQIAEARADGAETVVTLLHWGFEYEHFPDPHFMVLARSIIALGADLVVGQGPHVVQPPEVCFVNQPEHVPGVGTCSLLTDDGAPRTAAVLYSLGNFGAQMGSLPAQVGLVATVSVDDTGVTGLGWDAVATIRVDELPFVVPLDDLLDDPEYVEERDRLREHIGAGWERR